MSDYLSQIVGNIPSGVVVDPKKPTVSMLVITYGRCAKQPHLLDEAVWWCCNQTWPNVEVLVLNDAPGQKLSCDHGRVRCINWPERLPDLGTKCNLAVSLAAGSICCPAEDDDISLPHRAAQAVRMLKKHEVWFPMLWLYSCINLPEAIDGNGHGYTSSAYRRDSMLGCHPEAIKGHDQLAAKWARDNLLVNETRLTNPKQVSYVYRWGVSPLHLSGTPDPIEAFRTNDPGPDGDYVIRPQASRDWVGLALEAAKSYVAPVV